METTLDIHPARRVNFEQLLTGLKDARSKRLVYERTNADGLLLYVYSGKCVYDAAWDEYTTLARGLILDPMACAVVATPFPKFFNLGENGITAPDLPFDTFEKLDGSLIIIFHHSGRWRCATKGAFTSSQALWAQQLLNAGDLSALVIGTTYLAEATYPENRIVIHYEEPGLVVLAAYAEDGAELPYDEVTSVAAKLGWRTAQRHSFTSISELITCAEGLPRTLEGFVIRYSNGLRLKVKGNEYRRLHALISRVTPLAIWEVMAAGDDVQSMRRDLPEEFWQDFDQIYSLLQKNSYDLSDRIENLCRSLENLSDKEVGLRLDTFEKDLRPFIFSYRKMGNNCLSGRARDTFYRTFRPTGNVLAGYTPSYALNRVLDEAL